MALSDAPELRTAGQVRGSSASGCSGPAEILLFLRIPELAAASKETGTQFVALFLGVSAPFAGPIVVGKCQWTVHGWAERSGFITFVPDECIAITAKGWERLQPPSEGNLVVSPKSRQARTTHRTSTASSRRTATRVAGLQVPGFVPRTPSTVLSVPVPSEIASMFCSAVAATVFRFVTSTGSRSGMKPAMTSKVSVS